MARHCSIRLALARAFIASAACATIAFAATRPVGSARLKSRPGQPTQPAKTGLRELGLVAGRDAWLFVPDSYVREHPVPLIVMLHGARGKRGLEVFAERATKKGIAVLVPDSRGSTWDLIASGFTQLGPDVVFIDRALRSTFSSIAVDPRHIAMAGFSDGASYALSLGMANGDLFTHVMAYSPGGLLPPSVRGRPRIFIAHGIYDNVLPIKTSSREIMSRLLQSGYAPTYREFRGGHSIDLDVVEESFRWFIGSARGERP